MDNLRYLDRLDWGQWLTSYSRSHTMQSVEAYNRVNEAVSSSKIDVDNSTRPQVIVVGEQGCGKSSILESIIGTGFLPKGSAGLVTRCPIIINLVRVEYLHEYRYRKWVEFDDIPSKQFLNMEEVEKEIRSLMMNNILSSQSYQQNTISEKPIRLSYFSSEVSNMTLIDLPGFIADNDESPTPETNAYDDKLKLLIEKFTGLPNSVILAVVSGDKISEKNENGILDYVKSVDPLQQWTLTVVSKWDLLPTISLGQKILKGKIFSSAQGVAGIINRSSEDVEEMRRSVQDVQVASAHFIRRYLRGYDKIDSGVGVGPNFLVQKICELILFAWGGFLDQNMKMKEEVQLKLRQQIFECEKQLVELPVHRYRSIELQDETLRITSRIFESGWKSFGTLPEEQEENGSGDAEKSPKRKHRRVRFSDEERAADKNGRVRREYSI